MAGPAQTIPPRLTEVFAAFAAAGIRWSLLRPREMLGQPEGDIDVLVEPAELQAARRVLARLGFLEVDGGPADLHAVEYDEQSGRFFRVHLQTVLRVAGREWAARAVLDVVPRSSPPQPPGPWLFWILLLRGLLEKHGVPVRHRAPLAALASEALAAPEAFLELAARHELEPTVVVPLAAAGDWAGLEALPVVSSHRRPSAFGGAARRVLNGARAFGGPRGMTVAVLGPDGAGKTTLVTALARSLPLPTRVHYLGLTGGRLPRADALRLPGLVFAARLVILWWRYLRGAYHRARGRIVLFDRYTLDGAVPSGRVLRPGAQLSRHLQRRVLPLPDLVLLLDASGATLHARKGEYDPQRLEVWRSAYQRLRRSVAVLEVLDAERPADDVLRDAEARVWRRYEGLCRSR